MGKKKEAQRPPGMTSERFVEIQKMVRASRRLKDEQIVKELLAEVERAWTENEGLRATIKDASVN